MGQLPVLSLIHIFGEPEGTQVTETPETEIVKEVKVDGITITGMTKNQARNAILKEYSWSMTVTYGDDSYPVTDLVAEKVDALLDDIYSGDPEESYTCLLYTSRCV